MYNWLTGIGVKESLIDFDVHAVAPPPLSFVLFGVFSTIHGLPTAPCPRCGQIQKWPHYQVVKSESGQTAPWGIGVKEALIDFVVHAVAPLP